MVLGAKGTTEEPGESAERARVATEDGGRQGSARVMGWRTVGEQSFHSVGRGWATRNVSSVCIEYTGSKPAISY